MPGIKLLRRSARTITDGASTMFPWHTTTLVLFSAMMAGCAATHGPESGGRDLIHVSTVRDTPVGQTIPTLGWGTGRTVAMDPIAGARCTVSNDRGNWSVTTPASVEVDLSAGLLRVACTREGFRDASQDFRCVSPRAQAIATGAAIGLQLGAAAGAAAAVAIGPAGVVAAVTGPALVGGAAGHALAGPDTVRCKLSVVMSPAP